MPLRPSLHRTHSSISYHPSPAAHKPALSALVESPTARSIGYGQKKWFVLVEYGPELDSDHLHGGAVLSFLQPTAHQQLIHTIPQLHLPSPIGLSLLLKVSALADAGPNNARVDDAVWPHLFAGFFLPHSGHDTRGMAAYGHLPIAAHFVLRVDKRKAKWYESWWNDRTIGSLEKWVDLDRYKVPQDDEPPVVLPERSRPRALTTPDHLRSRLESTFTSSVQLLADQAASELTDTAVDTVALPIKPAIPQPSASVSHLLSRNKLSLSISVPSPAAWSNATSWGPTTTFSPYPPNDWMGSPGHVWTPDVGQRVAGSVPSTPILPAGHPFPRISSALRSHERATESAELDRQGLWDGVWPFPRTVDAQLRRDREEEISNSSDGDAPTPPARPLSTPTTGGDSASTVPWDGVWPFFESKGAVEESSDPQPSADGRVDPATMAAAAVNRSDKGLPPLVREAVAPPPPKRLEPRSSDDVPRSVPTLSRSAIDTKQTPQTTIPRIKNVTHPAKVNNRENPSLFTGTMFGFDSIDAFSLASDLSPLKLSRGPYEYHESELPRSPSPPHVDMAIRRPSPPQPLSTKSLSTHRASGLPQVRPLSKEVTSRSLDASLPISAWKAPWEDSGEPPIPPLLEASVPSRGRGTSSLSSSLYQTPAASTTTTTVASTPLPSTPKRTFKRLSRSLSSSVSSFSEGGVDPSMPLNSPRPEEVERQKTDSPSFSPTVSEFESAPVGRFGGTVVYPSFDIYPSMTLADAVNIGVAIEYPNFDLYPVSTPSTPAPVDIGVRPNYPVLDIYPIDMPLRGVDIAVSVRYAVFSLHAPRVPTPVSIGVSIAYPILNIYPAPQRGIEIGVAIRYPNMSIYAVASMLPGANAVSITSQPVLYPNFGLYPGTSGKSTAVSVGPPTLSQYKYPNIVIYPKISSPPPPEPRSLSILLAPLTYPNIVRYPRLPTRSVRTATRPQILLSPVAYPNIIIYPKAKRSPGFKPSVAPILLAPFEYPRIVLYPSQVTGSVVPMESVTIVPAPLAYPMMIIYPLTKPQGSIKPVLQKLNTRLRAPPRPLHRSARSQTVSTVNSVDFVKTPESATSFSTFRTLSHLPSPKSSPESPALRSQEPKKSIVPDLPLHRFTKRLTSPFEALAEAHQSLTHEPVQRRSTPARSTYVPKSRPQRKSQADLFWAGVTGNPV